MRFSWLAFVVSATASVGVSSPVLATPVYWNLFNFEGESVLDAIYVTYDTRDDMLTDSNRTSSFMPNGGGAGRNVIAGGTDGSTYWNLFNFEGESVLDAIYVTYATLDDMLTDSNRVGSFTPAGGGAGRNVIAGGADGSIYWNLFNFEGESFLDAIYVTYATLDDMLTDSNRTGSFTPNGGGAGRNVIAGGAFVDAATEVPEPASLALLAAGLAGLGLAGRRRTAG